MPWIYPALIAVTTLSIGTLLERQLMKHDHSDPLAYAVVFQIMLGFSSLILALLFNKFRLPVDISLLPRFILASFLWAGSTVFGFQAMKRLEAGEVTIIGAIGTVITMCLSVLLLHETISLRTVSGMGLILISIFLILNKKLTFKSKAGIIFAMLSAICAALGVVNDVVILASYEAFSYMTIMSFLPALPLWIIKPQAVRQSNQLLRPLTLQLIAIFALVYAIQGTSYYVSLEYQAPLSQLSPIVKTSTVLTVMLAAIFLRERSHLGKKILAAIITTIGAILIG